MMGAAAAKKEEGGRRGKPINIDFLAEFVRSSPAPGGDDVRFVTPPPAARTRTRTRSPGGPDVYPVSSSSAPAAKGKRKRRWRAEDSEGSDGEYMGMSNEGMLRREIVDMSDGELQQEIECSSFARLLTQEKRERRERLLPLLEKEARRRGIRTAAAKDGDDRNRGAHSTAKSVYTFDIEDDQTEDANRKYFRESYPMLPLKKNYGSLGVRTRSSYNQTAPTKPITVDKMYSSKTSPTALRGHTMRVRAVDPKERHNETYRQNGNNNYSNHAKRRKAHHEDSSLLHQKVNDLVLLDDEDVQPDEPVDCAVLEKWKELKIYYPSSDDPQAVELSSSDIRCLNPGVYLSSPVINYYIQYIKRAEMRIEYGTEKFHMFNTYFYGKLQEALLDQGKFLKLRRWWKGVNIFQRGYIILPIHGTSHWSLVIVCIPAKESNSGPIILHLDSLGMHPSAEIFDTVGRYLEEEWRHLRKNPPSDISIPETIWQDLPSNIQKEKVEVPGQNNAYDCGVFMLFYIQQFIKQAPERFTRDSLDMFSRSWFRSEVASGLRKGIRKQLLELFGNASVDGVITEAAASDGSDEACIIKEGEPEAAPCDTSENAVGGGDTSIHSAEDVIEVKSLKGTPFTTCGSDGRIGDCALSEAATLSDNVKDDDDDEECIIKVGEPEAVAPCGSSEMAVGGGDTSTRDEEDFIEVKPLGGTPTTSRSDVRIRDCALSKAATLSDNVKDDDDDEECIIMEGEPEALARCGSSEMAVGGGDTSTRDEEDFIEVKPLGGTPSTTSRSDLRIRDCALSKAATLSDSIEDDDTVKTDPGSSKTEQDIEILPSDKSKNNGEVMHSTSDLAMYCPDSDVEEVYTSGDPSMYCPDSDVEEVNTPEVEKLRRKGKICFLS